MPVRLTYAFDGGTNGAAIPTANGLTIAGGAPLYTTASKHGSSAFSTGAAAATTSWMRAELGANPATHSGSMYVRIVSSALVGAAESTIVRFSENNSNNVMAQIKFNGNGKISLNNTPNTTIVPTVASFTVGQWFRLDWQFDSTAPLAPVIKLRLFLNPESNTMTEEIQLTGSGAVAFGRWGFGSVGTAPASREVAIDTFRVSDGLEWIGAFAPEAPTPVVNHMGAGGQASTGFTVAYKTTDATTVKLAVSTNSGMTSPVLSTATSTPDANGYGKITITGLAANTRYWYQLQLNGTLYTAKTGQALTFPTEGSQYSFSFIAASCAVTNSNDTVFDAMRTRTGPGGRKPVFFAHLGDAHYTYSGTTAPNDATAITTAHESIFSQARQEQIRREIPHDYIYSDVDFCGSNTDGTATAKTTSANVVKKMYASHSLPSTVGGLERSFVIGRVRFVHTDGRTNSSAKAATEGPTKTLLGLEQEAWFEDQLDLAITNNEVVIWLHDNGWTGGASPGADNWQGYTACRDRITAMINARPNLKLELLHGDSHALYADNGTNNSYGGFPFACVAPMHQQANPYPRPVSHFKYPDVTITTARQYGWFDVEDTGNAITVTFSGYDVDGTLRGSMPIQFNMQASPAATVWDGEAETSLAVSVWNGTTEQSVNIEFTD